MKEAVLQILAATMGALGFGILFQVRGKHLLTVAVGGGLGWLFCILLNLVIPNEAVVYFIVAVAISLYTEVMARILKAPTTVFLAPSLIPLVPGASLYYTMAHAFDGELTQFVARGIKTVSLAAALAIGVILSAVLVKLYTKLMTVIHQKRAESLERRK